MAEGGQMTAAGFVFNKDIHAYFVDEKRVPNVTQMIDLFGLSDYGGAPMYALIRKQAIGTTVHRATALIDTMKLHPDLAIGLAMDDLQEDFVVDYDLHAEDMNDYVQAYLKFCRDTKFVPRLVEHCTVATVHGMQYGLTVDREGDLGKRATIVDLKCTEGKERYWPIQLAGYALGLPRPKNLARRDTTVCWLRPDQSYVLLPGGRTRSDRAQEKRDEDTFLAMLRMAWWKQDQLGHF
jgi:hypothetical protein